MKSYLILLALVSAALANTEQECKTLKTFLSQRKSNTIPEPMLRIKRLDGLLSCVMRCTEMNACRSYTFQCAKQICILLDGHEEPILLEEYLIIAVVVLTVSANTDQVCEDLKNFLRLRKNDVIPAPMSRVRGPDKLLSCFKNCTVMMTCKFYNFYIKEEKCVLLDEKEKPITSKENPGKVDHNTTKRPQDEEEPSKPSIKVYKEKKTWTQAQSFCQSLNGHLVVIQTDTKQQLVGKMAEMHHAGDVWIGAKDLQNRDIFEWIDGSLMNFTAWSPTEPSNSFFLTEENCVQLMMSRYYRWNDNNCEEKCGFICEIDPVLLQS